MERFDVSQADRFAEMVSAAEAGAAVEITREGAVVATMTAAAPAAPRSAEPPASMGEFLARIRALHTILPPELKGGDVAADIRAMRDED